MKKTLMPALLMLLMAAVMPALVCSQGTSPSISIDGIASNVDIKGKVTGLTADTVKNHKVVVYVKTDKWYIHPYAAQGEGASWASIAPDGSWVIGTVLRQFPASHVAALLVKKDYSPPATALALPQIPSTARVVRTLTGTPDHGKL